MSKWNQRSITSKGLAVASLLIFSQLVSAAIDFSPKLAVESGTLIAFPILGDCKTWHYFPLQLYGRGPINHQLRRTRIKGGEGVGIVNAFEFEAHTGLSDENVNSLRQKIFERASTSSHCLSSEEKAGLPDGTRATAILRPKNVEEVSVVSAQVKIMGNMVENDEQFDPEYIRLAPTFPSKDSWDRASQSRSLTLFSDATNPVSAENSTRTLLGRGKTVGELRFSLDGVLASVDAQIKLKTDMMFEFVSFLDRTCKDTVTRGNAGAIIVGYAMAGVPGAFLGSQLDERTKNCVESLRTYFKGGDISGIFENNIAEIDDKDENGNPIMIETCDVKGKCGVPVPLQTYVKGELLTEYMFAGGLLEMLRRAADKTLESEIGKHGKIKTTVNFLVASKRALHGRRIFNIKVIADGLELERTAIRSDPLVSCAQSFYRSQVGNSALNDLIGVSPLPIHPACLKGN